MSSADFIPTRAAALDRLQAFVPCAGAEYAAGRNHDRGSAAANQVSRLSPYLRYRLISEDEVIRAVLHRHDFVAAERFIDEVCWRTYWKGWLELHPTIWTDYRHALQAPVDSTLQARLAAALNGHSGIACFDHWVRELLDAGYLHNHARMWFASIWIFTLRLPWQRGADFFLQHLLDGDPASNTLSWRWVAGLQTPGKHYLARAENIARFTEGRFNPVGELDESAAALPLDTLPALQPLAALPSTDPSARTGWLLHEDDLQAQWLMPEVAPKAQVLVTMRAQAARGPAVKAFVDAGLSDAELRAAASCASQRMESISIDDNASWLDGLTALQVRQLVTAEAPVGPAREQLDLIEPQLTAHGIRLVRVRRDWDAAFWPKASRGFFPFRSKIRSVLTGLRVTDHSRSQM